MEQQLAFVFPGQGSQSVAMLSELAGSFSLVKEVFDEASSVLGYDAWDLVQNGPKEQLNQTEYTQPLLLAADVAVWRCWLHEGGLKPAYMAGHSLGEYAALVCAESLSFAEGVRLVASRGQFMQSAVAKGQGAMAAIVGLPDQDVADVCVKAAEGAVVSPANYNSIGQVVIAGETAAVERAIALAKAQGAKMAKLIPVSVPSHCSLMQPAADQLRLILDEMQINEPKYQIVQNVDVQSHKDPQQIRDNLLSQLTHSVRWVETVQWFEAHGVTSMIECGPGMVLAKLNKRISSAVPTYRINTVESLQQTLVTLTKGS